MMTEAADEVTNQVRLVSADTKRNATSVSLADESTNKKRRIDRAYEDENIKDMIAVKDEENQGKDEEICKEDQIQVPIVPAKELIGICYNELNSHNYETVREGMKKLRTYCAKDDDSSNTIRATTCRTDIVKNNLIHCIIGALYRYMDKTDILYPGLTISINVAATIRDSSTIESAIAMMNMIILVMQAHPRDSFVQGRSCWLLNNVMRIGCKSPIHNVAKDIGILKWTVSAMEQHPACKEVQLHGCSVLNHYYDHVVDDRKLMKETCLIILAKNMRNESDKVRKRAVELMQKLGNDIVSETCNETTSDRKHNSLDPL